MYNSDDQFIIFLKIIKKNNFLNRSPKFLFIDSIWSCFKSLNRIIGTINKVLTAGQLYISGVS